MTKDEALKLAMEALNRNDYLGWQTNIHVRQAIKEALAQPEQEQFALKHRIAELEGAVIGLQARLAQPEGCQCPACKITPHASDCAVHNAPAYPIEKCNCGAQPYPDNFIDALKFDVAKRDSEAKLNLDPTPISGWGQQSIGMDVNQSDHRMMENAQGDLERINLVQTGVGIGQPAQQQEPVAWRYALDASVEGPRWIYIDQDPQKWLNGPAMVNATIEPLYTTPPHRKPLTDEETMSLCAAEWASHPIEVARAIEAAHGIKGEA